MSIFRRILDAFGREIPAQPDGEALRARSISDRPSDRQAVDSILCDVTPQRIARAFREADAGYPAAQMELAETIEERDAHVASCLTTRRADAAAVDWVIAPGDETDAAAKCADAFRECWESLDTQAIREFLLTALLPQWAVMRVIWDTDGRIEGRKLWRPILCEQVDRRRLVWPQVQPTEAGDISVTIPQISLDMTTTNTEPLEAGRYIAHACNAMRGRPGRMALVRCVAMLWMLKRYSFTSLGVFCERFGVPHVGVKYDPQRLTREEISEVISDLAEAASGGAFGIPIGSEMELIQAVSSGTVPHEVMIRLCDEGCSKAIVGSTTVADAANTGASQSVSSPTHQDVRIKRRNSDVLSLAGNVRNFLAVPFAAWNFGPGVATPKINPVLAEKPEPKGRSEIYRAAKELGLRCKSDQVYDEMGIEKPEGVPDVLFSASPTSGGTVGTDTGADGLTAPVGRPAESEPVPGTADQTSAAAAREFNGAQVTSATEILVQVATGEVAPDAAVLMLVEFFGIDEGRARTMVTAQALRREERKDEAAKIAGGGSPQSTTPPQDGNDIPATKEDATASAIASSALSTQDSALATAGTAVPRGWVDAAASAGAVIGQEQWGRARAWIAERAAEGLSLEQIRERLPELMAIIGTPEKSELLRQAMMAAGLAGRAEEIGTEGS